MQLVLRNGKLMTRNGGAVLTGTTWSAPPLDHDVFLKQFAKFQQFITLPTPPPPVSVGMGIITLCFGKRIWPMTLLQLRMLRETGCKLPLQIWHDGTAGPVDDPLTTLVDIRTHGVTDPISLWDAWAYKTFALRRCGWQRAFFIDADAYCVADPTPLFDLLNIAPFVYWSNFDAVFERVRWTSLGIPSANVPPVQGGHILIDIPNAWQFFTTAEWLNTERDYYYRYCGFGDEDTYRMALTIHNAPAHVVSQIIWNSPAITCTLDGMPMIVHRCGAKLYPDTEQTWNHNLPRESHVRQLFEEIVNGDKSTAA